MCILFLTLGGSKGIGRCIVEQLLREGCRIVSIIARDIESLEKTKRELTEEYGLNTEKSIRIYSLDLNSGQSAIKVNSFYKNSLRNTRTICLKVNKIFPENI